MEDEKLTILPKGSIVKVKGIPCELMHDIEVASTVFAQEGLDWPEVRDGSSDQSQNVMA